MQTNNSMSQDQGIYSSSDESEEIQGNFGRRDACRAYYENLFCSSDDDSSNNLSSMNNNEEHKENNDETQHDTLIVAKN